MTNEPRWDPAALEDLRAGHDWYDEREPGLGRELAAEVQLVLAKAVRNPLLLRKYEHINLPSAPEVRKIQLKRFDEYGIIYAVVDEVLWVVAIAHAKRGPGFWTDRVARLH